MKKAVSSICLLLVIIMFCGCVNDLVQPAIADNSTSTIDGSSTPAASASMPSSVPLALSDSTSTSEPTPVGNSFVNQTTDMTFTFSGQICEPGQQITFEPPFACFSYSTSEYEYEQVLGDIAHFTKGDITIVVVNDLEKGHTLTVEDEDDETPPLEYLLMPQGLRWMRCNLDQKLYLGDIPNLTVDELLEIYPNAIVKENPIASAWADLYNFQLWCYEPLYNLKIAETNTLVVDDEIVYGYVDWNSVESFILEPNSPLLTGIVSVGSMWCLAVHFEDAQGKEYTYIAWENGMGGDRPGLILQPVSGRILTEEETNEIHRQRGQ